MVLQIKILAAGIGMAVVSSATYHSNTEINEPGGLQEQSTVSSIEDFSAAILPVSESSHRGRAKVEGNAARVLPALTQSGPLIVETDGQIIQNLHIVARGDEDAIRVLNVDNVVIRNVVVEHENGRGVQIIGGDGVTVEDLRVYNRIAPDAGPHKGQNAAYRVNLYATGTTDLRVDGFYGERGSSGIYIQNSVRPKLTRIEGFDVRGPFPRGQLVQFNQCVEPVLDTFTLINPGETAWSEDGVNAYGSVEPVIRNGYIDGINSPTGIGVIIENAAGGYGGHVENVDVRHWVNGAFMAAYKASDVTFRNVRAIDGLAPAEFSDNAGRRGSDGGRTPTLEEWAGENFRGKASSGQEAFFAFNTAQPASISYLGATYVNLPRKKRVAWNLDLMENTVFRKQNRVSSEIFQYPYR